MRPNASYLVLMIPNELGFSCDCRVIAYLSVPEQAFLLSLEDGVLDYANTYPNGEQPIVCDGYALVRNSHPPPPPGVGGVGAIVGGVVGACVAGLLCIGLLWARRRGGRSACGGAFASARSGKRGGAPRTLWPASTANAKALTDAMLNATGTLKVRTWLDLTSPDEPRFPCRIAHAAARLC